MNMIAKTTKLLFISLSFLCLAFSAGSVDLPPASNPAAIVPNFWDLRVRLDKPSETTRTIRFLASDDYPPFAFRDPAGRLTGFNVDLARALCDKLSAICTLRIKPFDELIPALRAGEGDAVIAGLMPARNTADKTLIFSDPYLKLPARFVLQRDEKAITTATPETMAGKWISAVTGSAHAAFLQRFFSHSHIATYANAGKAREALRRGDVDAHFGDGLSLSYWLQGSSSTGCCVLAPGVWIEPKYFDHSLTVAMRAEDEKLKSAINYALQQVYTDGRYGELYLRYFPISFY